MVCKPWGIVGVQVKGERLHILGWSTTLAHHIRVAWNTKIYQAVFFAILQ